MSPGSEERVLEIQSLWGDTILDVISFIDDGARAVPIGLDGPELRSRYVSHTPMPRTPLGDRLDYRWLNSLIAVFFVHALAITISFGAPERRPGSRPELLLHKGRFMQVMLTPAAPPAR